MLPRDLLPAHWGIVLSGLLGLPSVGAGQGKGEFTPLVGLYLPTANVIDQFIAGGSQVSVKQNTAFIVGGRAEVWITDRLGLEGSVGYTGSGVTATTAGVGSANTSGSIIMASARLLGALGPRVRSTSFYVSGGVGLVARGGDAWAGTTDGKTKVGGAIGIGARFKVAPSLALRAEAEDFLYSAQFRSSSSARTDPRFQNDLVLSLGLALAIGGR